MSFACDIQYSVWKYWLRYGLRRFKLLQLKYYNLYFGIRLDLFDSVTWTSRTSTTWITNNFGTLLSIFKYTVPENWRCNPECRISPSPAASSNGGETVVPHEKTLWTLYERNNPLVSNTIQANYRGRGPGWPTGINVRVKLTARQPGWLPPCHSPFIIFSSLLQLARTLILASLMRLCYFSPYPWQLDHRQPRRRLSDSCKPIPG